MTVDKMTLDRPEQNWDTPEQDFNNIIILRIILLSTIVRNAIEQNYIYKNAILLRGILLCVSLLSGILLSIILASVILLNVFLPNVVPPFHFVPLAAAFSKLDIILTHNCNGMFRPVNKYLGCHKNSF
jgi:hypothetical protein